MKIATRWEVKIEGNERSIQLFDKDGKKIDGRGATWEGDFYCYNNQLTSLAGAPELVGGSFYCNSNQLTSLAGAPESVGDSFSCNSNQLTSLAGAPESVGGSFYCYSNQLTSLAGAPELVGGGFYCNSNQLTSLDGEPKKMESQAIASLRLSVKLDIELSFLVRGFAFFDGIIEKIIGHTIRGEFEIFKTQKIDSEKTGYVVLRGLESAHGETIKQAIESLQYKVSDRDTTEYLSWKLTDKKTRAELVVAYRKITGACEAGVKDFLARNKVGENVTIKEVIALTSNSYGHEQFKSFNWRTA